MQPVTHENPQSRAMGSHCPCLSVYSEAISVSVEIRVGSRTWAQRSGSLPQASRTLTHKSQQTPLATTPVRPRQRRTNTNIQVPAGTRQTHTLTHHVSNTHSTRSRPVTQRSRPHPRGGVAHTSLTSHGARHSLLNAPSMPQLHVSRTRTLPSHAPHAPRQLPRRSDSSNI